MNDENEEQYLSEMPVDEFFKWSESDAETARRVAFDVEKVEE